jgi:murein L,D-transpeptidase YafK
MGDAAIEEIYTLLAAAFAHGQDVVQVHAFPFRFDRDDLATRPADPQWGPFWAELRAGWEAFESARRAPAVRVADGRYRVETAP